MSPPEQILSRMKQTLATALHAYNTRDYPLLRSLRSPSYTHTFYPTSLALPPMTNSTYEAFFTNVLIPAFSKFHMHFLSEVYDAEQRKATVLVRLEVDSEVMGPASTEFVLMMGFDEDGVWEGMEEFVDVGFNERYFAKVVEAMKAKAEKEG